MIAGSRWRCHLADPLGAEGFLRLLGICVDLVDCFDESIRPLVRLQGMRLSMRRSRRKWVRRIKVYGTPSRFLTPFNHAAAMRNAGCPARTQVPPHIDIS